MAFVARVFNWPIFVTGVVLD